MITMKKFGEKFGQYEPVEIDHISVIGTKNEKLSNDEALNLVRKKGSDNLDDVLKAEMDRPVMEIAPAVNMYQISPDQEDLSDFIKKTFSWFNYYVVELGLNVMVGRKCKIPEVLFKIALKSETPQIDVVAYDIAPKDETEYTKLLSGNVKITLGISTLLKFIPVPLGASIPDLLDIDINPWEFEWGITRYKIDACGEKNCDVHWHIYETDVVQGFNPTMIVRAKKDVNTIAAGVKCIYKIKSGLCNITPEIESKERELCIWPY